MYSIRKMPYGYHLLFSGSINKEEMQKWLLESQRALSTQVGKFHVFVDMRNLNLLSSETQAVMTEGQRLYKAKGLERSVVILNAPLTKLQFTQLAKQSGIYQWERYIDASSAADWEQVGINWLTKAVDPDLTAVSK